MLRSLVLVVGEDLDHVADVDGEGVLDWRDIHPVRPLRRIVSVDVDLKGGDLVILSQNRQSPSVKVPIHPEELPAIAVGLFLWLLVGVGAIVGPQLDPRLHGVLVQP